MKGGFTMVPSMFFDSVNAAIVKFQQDVTDKKAMILPSFNVVFNLVRVPVPDAHGRVLPLMLRVFLVAFCRGVDVLRWA
jgi:hypothetical protein